MASIFVGEIEEILREKSLLKHPFYKMWSDGKLSMDALRGYANEYYKLEAAFPQFLLETRKHNTDKADDLVIMENYDEETARGKSHADMWLDFAEGLGLERQEVKGWKSLSSTKKTLNDIESMTEEGYLVGIAALLSYEANLQETSVTKIEGLKKHYGLTDRRSVEFFAVHGLVDIKHSDDWKIILDKKAKTQEQKAQVKQAVGRSMDSLWSFLDGIHEKYNSGSAC